MPKNILFCADGTWNAPDDGPPTNVIKLFQALVQSDAQTAKYDDGVGTGGEVIGQLLGGAFGDGLFQKIKDGYDWIAQVYQDGDRIFLFGFSRGAYTARSLAGMIALSGLPAPGRYTPQVTEDAFTCYRDVANRDTLRAGLAQNYGNRDVNIHVVGVWDTVGSLGIPGGIFASLDEKIYGFLDTSLHPNIEAAWHAVSIDERRREFPPTLWDAATAGQELIQVWFAGVHSDVGGGYPETALSDITLGWMMQKAAGKGALFDSAAYNQYVPIKAAGATGTIHDSWSDIWLEPVTRTIPPGSLISNSVGTRITQLAAYRPLNIPGGFPATLGGMQIDPVLAD